jgi:3'-phosphoadenosine 5'-phosphosulfate sulfotransferase (PAPS reductase)/FAD synthetase
MSQEETRHVVALSGGKDSSALALYLRDPEHWQRALGKIDAEPREPVEGIEYVFCDTGTELEETYDYLDQLEAQLGQPIERLRANVPPGEDGEQKTPFDHYLELYNGFLPSANMRWCTRNLKIKPFERYIGDDPVINYVGIRADEDREGYISTKSTIETQFPFKEDGLDKRDVYRILDESGVGRPDYYDWRSRSGCYFCFFQRKSEWVGLKENHPELYEKAKEYEKTGEDGERFTWDSRESLDELEDPERIAEIKERDEKRRERLAEQRSDQTLMEQFFEDEVRDMEDDGRERLQHLPSVNGPAGTPRARQRRMSM